MKYLVHLRPEQSLCQHIEKLGLELGLRPTSHQTHCTLYTLRADESNEDKIIDALSKIRIPKFLARLENIEFFDEAAVVVRVQKHEALMNLHMQVIDGLCGLIDKSESRMYSGVDEWRNDIVKKYGSAYVAKGYNPHITIGHGKTAREFKADLFTLTNLSVDSVFLSKKDGSWTDVECFKNYWEYPFSI